jgi:DNA polymerase-3 subunit gamma/tau
VIELDAASNRGIDQARELRDQAMYAPAGSRFRIYIIDEAHQLTTEAANALLKLVEEPPAHLRFIFATTEPEKLLGTIRSRTHHYPFRLVPTSILQQHLAKVCEQEGVAADSAALALAAKSGAGSVRDALSVLGQLVGGAGATGITYEDAVTQLGYTADALLDTMLEALSSQDGAAMFRVIDDVVKAGHDPRRFTTDLLERLRDLIILKASPQSAAEGLVAQPADRLAVLLAQSEALGMAELSRAADLVSEGLTALRGATAPRLHMELLAARLLVSAAEADYRSVLARIESVERAVSQGVPMAAAAPVATTSTASAPPRGSSAPPPRLSEVAPATQRVVDVPAAVEEAPSEDPVDSHEAEAQTPAESAPSPTSETPAVDVDALIALWPSALELIKNLPGGGRGPWAAAQLARPVSASGTSVTIGFNQSGPYNMVRSRDLHKLFAAALSQVARRELSVEIILDASLIINTETTAPVSTSPQPVGAHQVVEPLSSPDDEPSDDDPIEPVQQPEDLAAQMLGATVIETYEK